MGSPSSIQSLLIDSSIHSQHSLQPTQEMYGSCRCWADQWECSTRGGVGIVQQICTGHNWCWFIRNAARSTCCRFSPHTTSSNPFSFCTHLFIICIFFYWPGLFSETCAGGIVLRNRWYLQKVQGHVVRAQDGELGKPVWAVWEGHFAEDFPEQLSQLPWVSGEVQTFMFLTCLWKSCAKSAMQSSPSVNRSDRLCSRASVCWE